MSRDIPAGAGRGKPRHGPLPDQLALEFGECCENAKHQPPADRCGVDIGSLAGEDAETDLALHQIMHGVDKMAQVAPEAVEFPDDQGIILAQGFEAGLKAGTVVLLAGGPVLIQPRDLNTRRDQRVVLQIENLRAINLR